jgi:cell shape-determining protein MreC
MNFHLKSDRYERKKVPILKGITFVFVCFVLIQMITPTLLPGFFHRIVSPLWGVKTDTQGQLIAEMQAKIDSYKLIEQEHATLLAELGQKPPAEVLFGHVLVLPPQSLYDTIVIDIGSAHGVVSGKKVFAGNQILLGEIVEVQAKTSKARLFSSPNQKYEVVIGVASSSVRATATGRGGGMYEALVPRESKVEVGNAVTVPEISTMEYGKVVQVLTDPARAFDSVLFQSPIPMQSLRHVYVEK